MFSTLENRNSERHYFVVKIVAKCSDGHYILPQFSPRSSDVHHSFFTVIYMVAIIGTGVVSYIFVMIS